MARINRINIAGTAGKNSENIAPIKKPKSHQSIVNLIIMTNEQMKRLFIIRILAVNNNCRVYA